MLTLQARELKHAHTNTQTHKHTQTHKKTTHKHKNKSPHPPRRVITNKHTHAHAHKRAHKPTYRGACDRSSTWDSTRRFPSWSVCPTCAGGSTSSHMARLKHERTECVRVRVRVFVHTNHSTIGRV